LTTDFSEIEEISTIVPIEYNEAQFERVRILTPLVNLQVKINIIMRDGAIILVNITLSDNLIGLELINHLMVKENER